MTDDTHTPHVETAPASPPLGFGTASPPDPVEAAIERHQGARDELQRATGAVDAAEEADGAAWADLLATRPGDVPGAVRLLRYVSGSPASETVEDVQDLLRQLAASVEAAEAGVRADASPANLPVFGTSGDQDPTFAAVAEYRAAWDAAVVATREGNGDVPDEASEAMMLAYDRLRAVRPTTAAGYRALAETWAWRIGQDGEPGDTLGEQIAESLIAGAGVCVPPLAGPDLILAMIAAHLAARDAFTATVDAQDVDWVREHGGDTSDAAMASARAAWRAADQAEVAAWNALFDVRPLTPHGAAALIRHVVKWGPEQDGHADAIGLADALATIADGLVGMLGATWDDEPVDWHAPPPGFMASPAIEPFGFVRIEHGIREEGRRLLDIAIAEYRRRRPDRRWQLDMRSTEDGRRIARALQIKTLSALAHPDHVVGLGWRWLTAGGDASAGDHAPGATHGMGEGPASADTVVDPAFAVIEAHRAAFAELDRISAPWNSLAPGEPGFAEAEAASDEPSRREIAAYEALFTAEPVSLRSAKALAEYLVLAVQRARIEAEPCDGERGLRTVSGALHRLLGPGATDGAGRDWQAYAANHPGFVPYPAHAPAALMALDLAIRGEAKRLLALAEEEIARRRQDYAGYSDPEVWPSVERSLRREMRMEALAAVASDLPDDDAPDPALAAIAASRRAEAEMAAFGASAPERLTRAMLAREEALSKAQIATRDAAWATVPTTRAGRLALIEFARFQVELHRAPDGGVDCAEDLLTEILDALAAAITAERPEEVSAAGPGSSEPAPSNLDALALVSAIEAEWTALARINEDDWDEGAYTRRDALIAAADRLPADSREARHAKALALAWIMYADLWEAKRTRDDYCTDGRLAVDIHASLTAGSTTEHPDAALLALGPTIAALIAARDAVSSEFEEAHAQVDGLVLAESRRLAGMRARTLDGLVLKARFVERGADEELKDAIVADLLAMGGGR